jgi:hypothetical protein
MTSNMQATFAWLRARDAMCPGCKRCRGPIVWTCQECGFMTALPTCVTPGWHYRPDEIPSAISACTGRFERANPDVTQPTAKDGV